MFYEHHNGDMKFFSLEKQMKLFIDKMKSD